MQPTALWSISTDCASAREGLTNRRALPTTVAFLDKQVMGPPMALPSVTREPWAKRVRTAGVPCGRHTRRRPPRYSPHHETLVRKLLDPCPLRARVSPGDRTHVAPRLLNRSPSFDPRGCRHV